MSRADWLAERKTGIGASESAALFGLHPYISPLSLYESKIRESEPEDDEGNERMEDGKVIEPRIAARWEKATGLIATVPPQPLYRHPSMSHMTCSPDRLIGETTKPLELKWWENFHAGDEIPDYGQVQVQHQIAVLGSDSAAMGILGSFRSFDHRDIPRHDSFIALLMEKVDDFWRRVQERRPPDADGSAATGEALKRLYPRDKGTTIFLPPEAVGWAADLAAAKAEIAAAKERESLAKFRLCQAIGDATFGTLPDGTQFSYKRQVNPEHTVAKSEFRVLRKVGKK